MGTGRYVPSAEHARRLNSRPTSVFVGDFQDDPRLRTRRVFRSGARRHTGLGHVPTGSLVQLHEPDKNVSTHRRLAATIESAFGNRTHDMVLDGGLDMTGRRGVVVVLALFVLNVLVISTAARTTGPDGRAGVSPALQYQEWTSLSIMWSFVSQMAQKRSESVPE